MDGMTRATPETRTRGQRKVLIATTSAGAAALAVTGFLTVGLGTGATTATATTTTPGTTTGTTDTSGSTSGSTSSTSGAVSSSGQQPVASSGGS